MGNFVSPFLTNFFMSRFETEINVESEYFSRVCKGHIRNI